jgi:hypothetical protein
MNGCQIGTRFPILHAKEDQVYPIGFSHAECEGTPVLSLGVWHMPRRMRHAERHSDAARQPGPVGPPDVLCPCATTGLALAGRGIRTVRSEVLPLMLGANLVGR